jgi:LemA protein
LLGLILYSSIQRNYNTLVTMDEGVEGQWAQVENVYQRRADLIPNLVNTVKGYAAHERETLEGVVEARAKLLL